MAQNQNLQNANELWLYFNKIIDWIQATFIKYRPQMKSIEWGPLFDEFGGKNLDTTKIEEEISKLMMDDEVQKKGGIYPYVLKRDERDLNLRSFSEAQKTEVFEKQKGICPVCKEKFDYGDMDGDHIIPWSKGGKTVTENCQMLCRRDNKIASNK